MTRYFIDTDQNMLEKDGERMPLFSAESFEELSSLWLKIGWNERYHYTFTWLGQPVLQLPEDLMRIQEVLWEVKPDLIIETGVAFGGSLLFFASFCKMLGKGRVVGVDIALRKENRQIIENHPLSSCISLIEGDSCHEETYQKVYQKILPEERVLIFLDSNHSKEHVLKELNLYARLVSSGSYLIVADGFKKHLKDVPRGKEHWEWDNPADAVKEFLASCTHFTLEFPKSRHKGCPVGENMTHFIHAWLKRK